MLQVPERKMMLNMRQGQDGGRERVYKITLSEMVGKKVLTAFMLVEPDNLSPRILKEQAYERASPVARI